MKNWILNIMKNIEKLKKDLLFQKASVFAKFKENEDIKFYDWLAVGDINS